MNLFYRFLLIAGLLPTLLLNQSLADWNTDPVSTGSHEDLLKTNPLAIGPDSTYHLVFLRQLPGEFIGPGPGQAFYAYKSPEGEWSEPELISQDDKSIGSPAITVTPAGQVYIAYHKERDNGDIEILLAKKEEEGWTKQVIPASEQDNSNPVLKSDTNGNLHLAWNSTDSNWDTSIKYAAKINGEWETQTVPDSENFDLECPSLSVTPEGSVHLLFVGADNKLYHTSNNSPGGDQWTSTMLETDRETNRTSRMALHNGVLYTVVSAKDDWQDPDHIFYFEKIDGTWSDAQKITEDIPGEPLSISVSQEGKVVVAFLDSEDYLDYGTLVLIEKEGEETQEYVFAETENIDLLNAFIGFDFYENLFVIFNEEVGLNHADIFFSHQGIPAFTVSFDVVDEAGESIPDAIITLGDETNDPGDLIFEEVVFGTYSYYVEAGGFISHSGSDLEVNQDIEVEVIMTNETYLVTFEVLCTSGETIDDASIALGDETNDPGDYVFENTNPGIYSYWVNAQGYYPHTGDNLKVESDTVFQVSLTQETYTITFDIINEAEEIIEDAIISLDGQSNEPGQYVFEDIEAGTYNYTVSAEGYLTKEGELTLETNIEVTLTMDGDHTSVNTVAADDLSIYPNPAQDYFFIKSGIEIKKVRIFSLSGKKVLSFQPECKHPKIPVSSLNPGVYLIEVSSDLHPVTKKIYIQ